MTQPPSATSSLSAEYHDAHLSFARAGIVEAAAHREPILGRLKAYTRDARAAERACIIARLVEMADALDQDDVARTAETLRRAAAILDFEGAP